MNDSRVDSHRRILQLISGGLIGGVLVFAALTLLIVEPEKFNWEFSLLPIIALGTLLITTAASLLMPPRILATMGQQFGEKFPKAAAEEVQRAGMNAVTSATITACALREAPALLGLVVWMIQANGWGLVTAGLAVAMMILTFPGSGLLDQRLADFRMAARR